MAEAGEKSPSPPLPISDRHLQEQRRGKVGIDTCPAFAPSADPAPKSITRTHGPDGEGAAGWRWRGEWMTADGRAPPIRGTGIHIIHTPSTPIADGRWVV